MRDLFKPPFRIIQPFNQAAIVVAMDNPHFAIADYEIARQANPEQIEALILSKLKALKDITMNAFDKQIAAIEETATEEG